MKKRILSIIAAMAMAISFMPQAFAEDADTSLHQAFSNSLLLNSTNYFDSKISRELAEDEGIEQTVTVSPSFKGSSSITEIVTGANNDYVIYAIDFTNAQGNLNREKVVVANVRAKAEGQIKVSSVLYTGDFASFQEDLPLATINVKPRATDVGKADYTGIAPISAAAELGSYWNGMTGVRYIKFEFISETPDFCRPIDFSFPAHGFAHNETNMSKAVAWCGTNKTATSSTSVGGFSSEAYYVALPLFFYNIDGKIMDVTMGISTGKAYHNTLVQLRLDHPDGEVIAEYMYDTQNIHTTSWGYKKVTVPVNRYLNGTHLVYITLKTNGNDGTGAPYAAASNPASDFYNLQFTQNADTFAVYTMNQSHHYVGYDNETKEYIFDEKDYMNTKVRFDSASTDAENVMLLTALYDENNKLVGATTKMQAVTEGLNVIEAETKWQDAKNAGAGDYTWKAFIWNGDNLMPITDTARTLGTVTIAEEAVEEA